MFKDNLRISFHNFRIKLRQLDILTPQFAALFMLVFGIVIAVKGFRIQHPDAAITLITLIPDFYSNASTTLISIALTVLTIDALNHRHDERLDKIRLIRDIACGDNGIAVRAIVEIVERNLHTKGFLSNRIFDPIDITGAHLYNADLSHSQFHYSNFTGVELYNANLYRACFWGVQLQNADLRSANLTNADFIFTDLTNAHVTIEQLQSVEGLLGARLPNGKIYDGSFNRPGDIKTAQTLGININDPEAMKKFYSMTHEKFSQLMSAYPKPDRSDWGFS